MRLSEFQKRAILSVLSKYGQVFIYGSRTRDDLKGGDIDLLLLVKSEILQELRSMKYKLLIEIESQIGEQKIDLLLATSEMLKQDPFLSKIYPEAIPLA